MSRKANCWDNAPMESFFGSLKGELMHRTAFPAREALRWAIFDYVEAFHDRRHSARGFLTPGRGHRRSAGAA